MTMATSTWTDTLIQICVFTGGVDGALCAHEGRDLSSTGDRDERSKGPGRGRLRNRQRPPAAAQRVARVMMD